MKAFRLDGMILLPVMCGLAPVSWTGWLSPKRGRKTPSEFGLRQGSNTLY